MKENDDITCALNMESMDVHPAQSESLALKLFELIHSLEECRHRESEEKGSWGSEEKRKNPCLIGL